MMRSVEVGYWYSQCCWRDLCQIKTPEELAHVQEEMGDTDLAGSISVFPTLEAALSHFRQVMPDDPPVADQYTLWGKPRGWRCNEESKKDHIAY
jgi:hypothetical protein